MLPVTDSGSLVNIHVLVNPNYVDHLQNDFFNCIESNCDTSQNYPMNRQGITNFGKSQNNALDDDSAYKKGINTFYITPKDLSDCFKKKPKLRENIIICVTNSSRDGASGFREHYKLFENVDESSLDAARKSIYCISDAIFSANESDINYFAGLSKDNEKTVVQKCGSLKPCIHGSDAHKEEDLFNPTGNKFLWIKADLTFEGLKQIIYEPCPGERVKISPIEPDHKDSFKVIRKMSFNNTEDFPRTIYFNKNLNSIIGSRSSGKSALLTYLADCIDKTQTRELRKEGPGDGFSWDDVKFEYSIEWWNGKTIEDNRGSIVYVPQNFLYEISKDSQKIKEKIKPVLFNRIPKIATKYRKSEKSIQNVNEEIRDLANNWFELRSRIDELMNFIKEQGSHDSIECSGSEPMRQKRG